jgi:sortase A
VTEVVLHRRPATAQGRSRSGWSRLLRAIGWLLIAVGVVVLLYLVYTLLYTNLVTARAQDRLSDEWTLQYGALGDPLPGEVQDRPAPPPPPSPPPSQPVAAGDAYAAMWFERPGSDERPVRGEPFFVVEGTAYDDLKRGPGHYEDTAAPGQPGNFAVAGHRTTYGAPFYHLDELRPGDEVHVVDRQQREWVYEVTETRVVLPGDVRVIGPDPLGTGEPMLTLTTCEPRFSAEKRLIVFAQLATG